MKPSTYTNKPIANAKTLESNYEQPYYRMPIRSWQEVRDEMERRHGIKMTTKAVRHRASIAHRKLADAITGAMQ